MKVDDDVVKYLVGKMIDTCCQETEIEELINLAALRFLGCVEVANDGLTYQTAKLDIGVSKVKITVEIERD